CLDGDDAAQLEVPQKTLLGADRAEVGHKAVSDILIRIGPFSYIVELVLREVDESREVSVVEDVRPGVVSVQVKAFAEPLDHLQCHAVVNGVDDAVVVVQKAPLGNSRPSVKTGLPASSNGAPAQALNEPSGLTQPCAMAGFCGLRVPCGQGTFKPFPSTSLCEPTKRYPAPIVNPLPRVRLISRLA